jgi:hypothetical protein
VPSCDTTGYASAPGPRSGRNVTSPTERPGGDPPRRFKPSTGVI